MTSGPRLRLGGRGGLECGCVSSELCCDRGSGPQDRRPQMVRVTCANRLAPADHRRATHSALKRSCPSWGVSGARQCDTPAGTSRWSWAPPFGNHDSGGAERDQVGADHALSQHFWMASDLSMRRRAMVKLTGGRAPGFHCNAHIRRWAASRDRAATTATANPLRVISSGPPRRGRQSSSPPGPTGWVPSTRKFWSR